MAYIYPKGYGGGPAVQEGLKFGVIMGVLSELPTSLVAYGAFDTGTLDLILVETIGHLAMVGVGGIVIASVYGRNQDSPASVVEEGVRSKGSASLLGAF